MAREIKVVPYHYIWPELYKREKTILESIFGKLILDIHHFGSTSIKGMSAKPIIDIMVIVENIDLIDNYNELMIEKGYIPRGENGINERRYFIKLNPDNSGNHTCHIHIYQKGNQHITDELMFRDYLEVDAESFKEYEKIKIKAARHYRHSPRAYVDAKCNCIKKIMEKARQYYIKIKQSKSR